MGELLAEPGQLVNLDQQRRQLHPRQPGGGGLGERIRVRRNLFGGQRRHDQLTVSTQACESLGAGVRQDRLQPRNRRVQLGVESLELPGRVRVGASDGAEVVSLPGPPLRGQEQGGWVGVAA